MMLAQFLALPVAEQLRYETVSMMIMDGELSIGQAEEILDGKQEELF